MMPSVQGPAESPVERARGKTALYPCSVCPECLCDFRPQTFNQLFCSPAHRDQWNNRAAIRGRVLTPLAIVARLTRGGTRGDRETGKRAAQDAAMLIQRWRDEDAESGRMPHAEYLRRRYLGGFDPL
jgi:hypothetical protein